MIFSLATPVFPSVEKLAVTDPPAQLSKQARAFTSSANPRQHPLARTAIADEP